MGVSECQAWHSGCEQQRRSWKWFAKLHSETITLVKYRTESAGSVVNARLEYRVSNVRCNKKVDMREYIFWGGLGAYSSEEEKELWWD